MSKSESEPTGQAGAPQRGVQLCYWQISAGQRAAGPSRPWHIKAHGPHSWPPPHSSPAGHFKRLLGASQIPIKGPGCSTHPRKQTSQGDMIKSILLGKGRRTEKRFSRNRMERGKIKKKSISGWRDHSLVFTNIISFPIILFFLPQDKRAVVVFKAIRAKRWRILTKLESYRFSLSSLSLQGHALGHLI